MIDHLDETNTYKELTEEDARILNDQNYHFICIHFIDNSKATMTKQAHPSLMKECNGFTYHTNNIT